MKIQSYKFFIKQKKLQEEKVGSAIAALQNQIAALQKQIAANEERILALKSQECATIFELQNIQHTIRALYEENATIRDKIDALDAKMQEQKERLSHIHAQKKALESMLEKIKKEQQKRIIEQENRLANESFVHKILYHK